ncbi:MAG TPA: hypothetical protein DCE41_00415 [Cytophagales bacterium]|nr:hypothetical protein [Cytophagales bacterium]HAA19072.1 hypothetical protein [Cytophagales bacterium]
MSIPEQDSLEDFFAEWRAADDTQPVPDAEELMATLESPDSSPRRSWLWNVAAAVLLGAVVAGLWPYRTTEPEQGMEGIGTEESTLMSWESPTDDLLTDF